jgi:hypothetical protein
MMPIDPKRCRLEREIRQALEMSGRKFVEEHDTAERMDFYLPDYDIHIEVCRYYTPRKIDQLARAENVILVQGKKAAVMLARLLAP